MSYVHLWEQKIWCVGSQLHSVNNGKNSASFEDVRILQVIGNKSKRKKIKINSVAHNILQTAEQMTTAFAANRVKMTIIIIITTSLYSALIKRKTMSIA